MAYSGFKNSTFKDSLASTEGRTLYRGKTTCYENGRKLWEVRSDILRLSKLDALLDAQNMTNDFIKQIFFKGITS